MSWFSGALVLVPSLTPLRHQALWLVAPVTFFLELPLVVLCSTCNNFMLDSNIDGGNKIKEGFLFLKVKQKTVKGREKESKRNAYPGEWWRPTISAGSVLCQKLLLPQQRDSTYK